MLTKDLSRFLILWWFDLAHYGQQSLKILFPTVHCFKCKSAEELKQETVFLHKIQYDLILIKGTGKNVSSKKLSAALKFAQN